MWPMLVDYTDDECRRTLRKLELEAYASIISAFRAQGELNREKKKMLQDLSGALSISVDRHKAEIRRAVNDEHLSTIADRIAGPNTMTEWSIEGRRVVPITPRTLPQSGYNSIANYAADAQAARNATLPVPSATAIKHDQTEEEEEEVKDVEENRKRCSSPQENVIPQKFVILEHSPISPLTNHVADENGKLENDSNSSEPQQHILQSVLEKDHNSHRAQSTRPDTTKEPDATSTTDISSATLKELDVAPSIPAPSSTFVSSSIPVPSTSTTSSEIKVDKPTTSSYNVTQINFPPVTALTSESQVSNSSLNPAIVLSATTGMTQSVTSLSSPISTAFVTRAKASVQASVPVKTVIPPRLPLVNSLIPVIPPLTNANPTLNSAQRNISPIQLRPPCPVTVPSTVIPMSTLCQVTTSVPLVTQSTQPIIAGPRASTVQRTPSPILFRQSQPSNTLDTIAKAGMNTKIITKSPVVRPALNARAMVTAVSKAPPVVQKTNAIPTTGIMVNSSHVRQQQLPVRTAFPAQILGTTKNNATITYSQKVIPGPSQVRPTAQPIAKAIHYRNDGGLKIISQNVAVANRIVPKTPISVSNAQASTSSSTINRLAIPTSSTAITGSARIINFSQPINARFARAVNPSAISAVNLVNSIPGLRVTYPVGVGGSQVMRATIPAKPNVIVVHKAQVWPQTPGATIVMTSSGSLSRLSNEAIEEAVSLMQRQESNRHSGTAVNFKTLSMHHGTAIATTMAMPTSQVKFVQTNTRKAPETVQSEKAASGSRSKNSVESTISASEALKQKAVLKKDAIPSAVTVQSADKSQKAVPVTRNVTQIIKQAAEVTVPNKNGTDNIMTVPILKSKAEVNAQVLNPINATPEISISKSGIIEKTEVEKLKPKTTLKVNQLETMKVNAKINESTTSSKLSIPELNLSQLKEGQIVELPTELLGQRRGQLSKEVLKILQQAGLRVAQAKENDSDDDSDDDVVEITNHDMNDGATNLNKTTALSSAVCSSTRVLNSQENETSCMLSEDVILTEVGETQIEDLPDNKKKMAAHFLKSEAEQEGSIFLIPMDSPPETVNHNQISPLSEELVSLLANESLGDSPTSSIMPLEELVNSNVTIEIGELDSLQLELSSSSAVD